MTGAEMLLGDTVETEQEAAPQQGQQPTATEAERALRAEVKTLRQERQAANQRASEAENTARFWHEKAQAAPASKKEVAAAVEDENPADFIEQLTERGVGAIDELLAKRGYVRKEEVDARINQARTQVTVESALAREYPDLQDPETDFFKETARQYQDLVKETPELKGNPRTMRLAARLADSALALEDEKPVRRPAKAQAAEDDGEDDELDDTPARREDARVRRVQSQSVRGRATRREANDDTLDNVQKGIVANLRAAGANITEESLIKRIQGGTKLSGRIGMAAAAMRNRK